MRDQQFDRISRRAAGAISRRGSLLTMGSMALMAVARPAPAKAKKGKSKDTGTCKQQREDCRQFVTAFCLGRGTCDEDLRPCCDPLEDCKAGESLDCLFAALPEGRE